MTQDIEDDEIEVVVTVHAASVYIEQTAYVYKGETREEAERRIANSFFWDGVETPYHGWVTAVDFPEGTFTE